MTELLTRKEAAEYLSVKPQTISSWVYTGRLKPSFGHGRLARYRVEDLEEFLNQ